MWQAAMRRTREHAQPAPGLLRRLVWLLPVALLALVGNGAASTSATSLFPTIQVTSGAFAGQTTTLFGNVSNPQSNCFLSTWTWNFGDGQSGSGQSVQHIFAANTIYTVQLSVSDTCGNSGFTSQQVTIGNGTGTTGTGCTAGTNQIQMTLSASPTSVAVNQTVTFFVSSGGATSYFWSFGDGQTTVTTNAQTTHAYLSGGTFTASVTATIGNLTGCGSTTISVSGVGGTGTTVSGNIAVTANGPYSGNAGQAVTFHGFAYPTNATLTINSYTWNFGDGSSGSGQDTTHTYASNGSFTVTLTVTDTGNESATTSTTANIGGTGTTGGTTITGSGTVSANGITATITAPTSGSAGSALTFSATATTSNPGATISSYNWTFSDGGTASGQSVTHTFSGNGNFTANLTVFDSTGHVANATATVSVAGGSRVVSLKQGCNPVALTFPDNTPTGTVLTAVSPQSAVLSLWKLVDPTTGKYSGYFPNSTQASDLTTVLRLDAISICVNGAATLSEPAV